MAISPVCVTGAAVNRDPSWVFTLLFPKEKEVGFPKERDRLLNLGMDTWVSQGGGWALQEFRWDVFHPKHPRYGMGCHVCREASPSTRVFVLFKRK